MKVTCVAANPFNTICANVLAIWECSNVDLGCRNHDQAHLKPSAFFLSKFFSLLFWANFRTRTQNQHNFIYLKQYRLAKGSTWRWRWGKRFDYSITLIWWDWRRWQQLQNKIEKRSWSGWSKAKVKKNQRGQALEAVKREIYFEQAM